MTDRPTLTVLTINIWNRSGPWPERFALLRRGIETLRADVIGMQEVLSDGTRCLADEIADGLGYQIAFGCAKSLPGGYEFGNAILSRFPIARHEVFHLPSAETDEERSLLHVDLTTPHGTLPMFCTHLAWKFHHGYVREQQVERLAEIVMAKAPIEDSVLPPVVVGDFNARPEATEIRFLSGLHALGGRSIYLADCFAEVGRGPGYTFDAAANPFAALTHEAPRRIDYVFVRGPDRHGRGKPLRAEVVLDGSENGIAPSDHFGVLAEIGL
jgi:endonuclease/exonuclease/phosphatase family metal-dependent hydrolase